MEEKDYIEVIKSVGSVIEKNIMIMNEYNTDKQQIVDFMNRSYHKINAMDIVINAVISILIEKGLFTPEELSAKMGEIKSEIDAAQREAHGPVATPTPSCACDSCEEEKAEKQEGRHKPKTRRVVQ